MWSYYIPSCKQGEAGCICSRKGIYIPKHVQAKVQNCQAKTQARFRVQTEHKTITIDQKPIYI